MYYTASGIITPIGGRLVHETATPGACVYCTVYRGLYSELHTHTRTIGKYAAITPTTSISTDMIEPLL